MEGADSTAAATRGGFSPSKLLLPSASVTFCSAGALLVSAWLVTGTDSGESFLDGGVLGLLSASPDLNTEAIPTGCIDLVFVGRVTLLTEESPFFPTMGGESEVIEVTDDEAVTTVGLCDTVIDVAATITSSGVVLASVSDLIISVSGHLQVVTSTGETELTLLVSALGSAGSGGRGGRSGGANVSTG